MKKTVLLMILVLISIFFLTGGCQKKMCAGPGSCATYEYDPEGDTNFAKCSFVVTEPKSDLSDCSTKEQDKIVCKYEDVNGEKEVKAYVKDAIDRETLIGGTDCCDENKCSAPS